MAKGDKKKMQNQLNTQLGTQQNRQDEMMGTLVPAANQNQNYWNQAAQQSFGDYNDIMNRYRQMADSPANRNQPGLERVNYQRPDEMNEAFNSYRNFINTGGFSGQDIADMRARGVSPIRANYQNMTNEMMRQKNLQGGYSPNMGAVMTRLGAQRGQMTADAMQDVNARLAEQIQQGKMFGTTGMGGLSVNDAQLAQQAALANQNAGLEIARNNLYNPQIQALHGMASMFGTSPGMAATFGNQANQSMNDWLQANQLQQGIGQNAMQGQQMVAQTPSNFETGLGRVGQVANIGGAIAMPFMSGAGSMIPRSGMNSVYTDPSILRRQLPQAPSSYYR